MIMSAVLKNKRFAETPPELILAPSIPPQVGVLKGFSRAREIIDAGHEAALAAQEMMRRLSETELVLSETAGA